MQAFKDLANFLCEPVPFFIISVVATVGSIEFAKQWTKPKVFFPFFFASIAIYGLSFMDPNFAKTASKGDNLPIIAMLFMVIYFTWLGFYRAVQNDDRRARGEKLIEEEDKEVKVLVWPHLLYIEFIVGVFVTAFMLLWSIGIPAPLEEPASAAATPNPSKAPWYFLGLQEMLVYFDPWMAGVVAPSLIIVGLMAIPYIDKNPKGNGYYTLAERKFAIHGFMFGFIVLWVALVFLGTFLRGPNWNFFGPYQYWDPHLQPVLNNVNLSEILFIDILGRGLPSHWLPREAVGIVLSFLYVFALPVALPKMPVVGKFFRKLFSDLGAARYYVATFLFLTMMSLPLKMILRWSLNLKYIVSIPEYFFNI